MCWTGGMEGSRQMQRIPKDIISVVEKNKNKYVNRDCAQAGHNGPYCMEENSLRNTAHWIMSFSAMYKITGDSAYYEIIDRFSKYLHQKIRESKTGAVETMSGHINLVSISWIVEGLLEAEKIIENKALVEDAEYVWNSQSYDDKLHLWNVMDDSGKDWGKDVAFNHNLWYAMAGTKLYQSTSNKKYRDTIEDFFEHIDSHYMVYRDGRISHFIVNSGNKKFDFINKVRKLCIEISKSGTPWNKSNQAEYERAYHLFSLYALALIYRQMPELSYFKTKKFQKAKEYALDITNFLEFDERAEYAYGYNSPYYEFPLVEYVFGRDRSRFQEHIDQLQSKQNIYESVLNSRKDKRVDLVTLEARTYELMQMYLIMYEEKN